MTPLSSIFRFVGAFLTALCCRDSQATTWLPWLGAALLIALVLSPGTVTASQLAFQSSPPATPEPPAPTAPPEPEPPTATPIPPAPAQPTPVPPTPAPGVPTAVMPTQEPAAPVQEQPTQPTPAPTLIPLASPTPPTLPAQTPTVVPPPPLPPPVQPSSGDSQSIVNWVKFWDTVVVTLAYPWLCCGVGLLLLAPVALLFLEIKGRRRPPIPPELVPEGKRGNEE